MPSPMQAQMRHKFHRPIRLLVWMLALGLMVAMGTQVWAQERFARQLEKIKSSKTGATVEFVFSQPYQAKPGVEHKAGVFTIDFSGVGYAKKTRVLKPQSQSMYQEIRVVQNRYSTTVFFHLRDKKQQTRKRLTFDPRDKTLRMTLATTAPKAALSPQGRKSQELVRQMEKRLGETPPVGQALPVANSGVNPPSGSTLPASGGLTLGGIDSGEFILKILTMVIGLVVIIAGLYGVLFLYNRYFAHRLSRLTSSQAIKQLASFHIGPRQRIVVLDIHGEVVACGVTPSQITYLTHLGGGDGGGAPGRKGNPPIPKELADVVTKARAQASAAGGAEGAPAEASTPGKADSVHQFAQVLKQKVRSLKRIN